MKPKILMIGPSIDENGGISSVIKSYTDREELKDNIEFIVSYKDGKKVKKLIEFIRGIVKCTYKLTFDKKIKIIHIHSSSGASFTRKRHFLKLGKIFNKKVILHIHGSEFMKYYHECDSKNKNIIQETLGSADIVIALSTKWKEDLIEVSQKDNIRVIYNPVSVKSFKKSSCDSKNMVFMGRVGRRKGIYDLLDVMPRVISEFPGVKLNVCGDGEIENIKKIIKEKNISSNVSVLGWVNEKEKVDILSKSSINILPSYNEGLPVSILEAMASGIPTIATNIAGIPEEIEDGINGYLFKPGDNNKLFEKISILLKDEDLRKVMGRNSLNKVEAVFDTSVIEKDLLSLYREIVK